MNDNGRIAPLRATRQRDYLTDVLARHGRPVHRRRGAAARKPFFLELATFAPHRPYTPAPRDAPRLPGPPGAADRRSSTR